MNLLFVSIAFPPKNDPECLQTAKYYKYLSIEIAHVEVVTSANPTLNMPVDDSLKSYISSKDIFHSIRLFETKVSNFLFRKLNLKFINKPDPKFSFHMQSGKAIRKLTALPGVLYSRSFPLSSALMAYKIQKKMNLPWVLHLSDPWTISPLHHYDQEEKEYHRRWEEKCFGAASKIMFTSEATVEAYKKKYPLWIGKFGYSPNVYDPDDVKDEPLPESKKLKVLYTGGLTGARSPRPFLEAMQNLYAKNKKLGDLLEIVFAGDMDRANSSLFYSYDLPFVKHIGVLRYPEAVALQRQSHLLLVIDNPISDPALAMFFPSKLLDYMTAKRRIMAITTINSSTDNFLAKLGYVSFTHEDLVKIEDYIAFCLHQWERGEHSYFHQPQLLEEFNAKYQAQRLLNEFKQLASL